MEKANKPKSAAEVTPETIEAWKKLYPKGVHEIAVEDREVETGELDKRGNKVKAMAYKKGYVRNPTREDMKYAMTMIQSGGELAMVEALLEEMWLGGDEELLYDDDFFFAAAQQLQGLLKVRMGGLKKL